MDTPFDGAVLAKIFETAARFGTEINALTDMLCDLFSKEIPNTKPSLKCCIAGDPKVKWRPDDSSWVCTDVAFNIPLIANTKRKTEPANTKRKAEPDMYIGFQISLARDGIAIPGNEKPLLHVFFWDVAADFDGYYTSFPMGEDEPASGLEVVENRILVWADEASNDWAARQWTFSLQLTSLNSKADLQKCIIAPSIALLSGKPILEALPANLPGLIFYPGINELLIRPDEV